MTSDQDTVYIKKGTPPSKGTETEPAEETKTEAKAEKAKSTKKSKAKKTTAKKRPTKTNSKTKTDTKAKTVTEPEVKPETKPVKEVHTEPDADDDSLDKTVVRAKSATPIKKAPSETLPETFDTRPGNSTKRKDYEIGDKIANRYQLVVKIGSGGTSDVYKARDLLLEGEGLLPVYVAIKILNRSSEEFFNVIRGEVIKTRSLDHPNIVRIHDFNYDRNTYFIIMELLEGEPLDEIIKRSRPKGISLDHTLYITEKIASALKYTHHKGIIHSDLKPANIYLTKDNEVKIYDFGVARHFEEIDDYAAINSPNPDLEDNFTGYTPAYASAELIDGQTATVKDDIYSFACIIHEMLSSEHPYGRVPANKAQQQNKKLKKINSLSKSQWAGLQQALSLDPAKRTKNVDKLSQNLFENNKKKYLMISGACVTAALAVAVGILSFNSYNIKKEEVTRDEGAKERFTALMETPKEDIFTKIPRIKNLQEPQKSLFLVAQRKKIVESAKENAENVISKNQSGLYLAAIQELEVALDIYPDSHTLILKKQEITKSFEQRRAAAVRNFQLALVEPTYDLKEVRLKINSLSKEIAALDPSFVAIPSDRAKSIYADYTRYALNAHLFNKIVIAKEIGNSYFPTSTAYKSLLDKGKEYINAAESLYNYQTEVLQSPDLPYPDTEVRVLFSEVLKSLLTNSELVDEGKNIDLVHEDISLFLETTPLTPTVRKELRSQLFSSYLYLGSTFTAKGLGDAARQILDKAQEVSN